MAIHSVPDDCFFVSICRHCFMIPHDRKHVKMIEKQLDDMRSAMNQDEGMSVARYMSEGPAVPYGSKELCV